MKSDFQFWTCLPASTSCMRTPLDFPVLLDPDKAVAKAWQARILPASYLVDADGVLFARLGEDAAPAADALPVIDDRRSIATAAGPSNSSPITF